MNQEEQARKYQEIIAKAWKDEGFKQRLLSDTTSVLKAEGVELPPGVEVRIVEDTVNVQHLLLPVKPASKQLSESELEAVVGGSKTNPKPPPPPPKPSPGGTVEYDLIQRAQE